MMATTAKSIKDLPPEIRLLIFEPSIKDCIQNSYFRTPLLITAVSTNSKRELCNEALQIYERLCPYISYNNENSFNKQPMRELLKIESIRLVAPLRFRAMKITCRSNLEDIMLDFSKVLDERGKPRSVWGDGERGNGLGIDPKSLAHFLIVGSKKVKRLVLKSTKKSLALWENDLHKMVEGISRAIQRQPITLNVGDGCQCWVWENSSWECGSFVWYR